MKLYSLMCRKDTENIDPAVSNTGNGKAMILSKCPICRSKKSRFIKKQEAKGLLSNLVDQNKERIQKFKQTGDTNYIY